MPVRVQGFVNQALPVLNYPGPAKASADQGQWKTKRLAANEFLSTGGLTACSGLALCDAAAGVASLAHFDGSQSTDHIRTMIAEMLIKGADLAQIRASISGWPMLNQTAQSVYNNLAAANANMAAHRTTVYDGRDIFVVFGDGRVGWFGAD